MKINKILITFLILSCFTACSSNPTKEEEESLADKINYEISKGIYEFIRDELTSGTQFEIETTTQDIEN